MTGPARAIPPVSTIGARVQSYDRLAAWLLFLPIIGVTFLSKIAFPVGSTQISVGLPILSGTVALGLISGRMRLHPVNLSLYSAVIVVLLAPQIFHGNEFSVPSLALLIILHSAYGVAIKPGLARPDVQLKFFQNTATIIALCGVAQFSLQSVIGFENAFPIETKFPAIMVIDRFNYLNPLSYGSTTFKSNGLFMLEPASFGQLSAVAIIIELLYFRRLWRLVALAGGIVVSYSGTGLIVLAPVLLIIIIKHRRFDLLLLMVVGAIAAYIGFDALQLDVFARRIDEFSSRESSGFARYIGGFYLFEQYQWPDIWNALFGLGAGSAYTYGTKSTYAISELSWVKMIFEFGLIGGGLYFAFLFKCIFSRRRFTLLGLALAIAFLQNGALVPAVHALILSLLVWPSLDHTKETAAKMTVVAGPVPAALAR